MSKKARSEGNRVASAIKSNRAKWYVSDVDLEDSSEDMVTCIDSVKKTLGKVQSNFLLISAGVTHLIVACSSLEDQDEWLNESLKDIPYTNKVQNGNVLVLDADTPFKLKDVVRSNAFSYLRTQGLIQEESEDEDELFDF